MYSQQSAIKSLQKINQYIVVKSALVFVVAGIVVTTLSALSADDDTVAGVGTVAISVVDWSK